MTPTCKGLYIQCQGCIHKATKGKYPCNYSHTAVRRASGVQYERDFTVCVLKETNMQQFKPGDWVTLKGTLPGDKFRLTDKEVEHGEILLAHFQFGADKWEHWKPQVGEWCWFYNEDMNFTILGRYAGYEDGAHICVQYTYGNYKNYDHCEPFIGQLPTNTLKETNGTNISILLDY